MSELTENTEDTEENTHELAYPFDNRRVLMLCSRQAVANLV